MATIKQEVVSLFKALSDAENNTLGFLGSPSVPPLAYHSFLSGINIDECKSFMYYRLPQNPSFNEAYASDVVFRYAAITRDVSLRKMRRSDYYSSASVEYYDEMMRLENSKINTIQYVSGNTQIQSAKS